MTEFHFLRPAWFLALLPALGLLPLLWRQHGRASGWQGLVAPALLSRLLLDSARPVRRLPLVLLALGWLLAVTALAGPTWRRLPQPVYRAPIDRVILLDMSPSMATKDLKPDRLSRARLLIRQLLGEAREGRTALVVFAGEPHVVAPLTDDVATIEALLPALSVDIMPAPGDRAAPALRLAAQLLQRVDSRHGEVLLLSDGVSDPADCLSAIQALRQRGARLAVLGVGTLKGAPLPTPQGGFATTPAGQVKLARLDESGLQALARAAGGPYLRLGQGSPLALLQDRPGRQPGPVEARLKGVDRWVEEGPWLLLPLLLIAAAGFRRGWLALLLVVLLPPPQAQAFGWQDLWLRPDQQAMQLLEKGDAKGAAQRFEDPRWRATAQYRAGDYASAAKGFKPDDPDDLYNRGNALARAGRLKEALAAYEAVLEHQPKQADARFNHDLIERLLRQQQQKQQQNASGKSGKSQRQPDQGRPQQKPSQGGGKSGQRGQSSKQRPQHNTGKQPARQPDKQAAGRQGHSPQPPPLRQQQQGERRNKEQRQAASGQKKRPARQDRRKPAPGQAAQRPKQAGKEPSKDSAAQARADVAPESKPKAKPQSGARQQAQPDRRRQPQRPAAGSSDAEGQRPLTEKELALRQWLRQIPDDPAGLLRRKFMLEHLRRQGGTPTP